ncbi:MAG: glycosyltransferase [Gammaproteobacteria bacterium]|nr:glycosyltransferase [Gammaproteobacteria bacterium]
MLFPNSKLIIFSKAPDPGRVKTRLIPALGETGAAQLHQEMLEQKLKQVTETEIATIELCCAPNRQHPYFRQIASRFDLELRTQTGDDLGERMANAIQTDLHTPPQTVIIGTDCPPLDLAYIAEAFQALQDGTDAVIGPATDGGYVLLGLNRFSSDLFTNIDWGTNRVCDQTRARLHQLGFTHVELDTLWDVDRPEDLDLYRKHLHPHRRTTELP